MLDNQHGHGRKYEDCVSVNQNSKKIGVMHLHDVLIHALRRLSHSALSARAKGIIVPETDRFMVKALVATLSNSNFTPDVVEDLIEKAIFNRKKFAQLRGCKIDNTARPIEEIASMKSMSLSVSGLSSDQKIQSAMQMLLHGLKGTASYVYHASILGKEDDELYAFIYQGLAAGVPDREGNIDKERDLNDWLDLLLQCGRMNIRAIELLDR